VTAALKYIILRSVLNWCEAGCEDVKWIYLARDMDQCVGSCEHGNEHLGNFLIS
jgi:hypothetical protein